jgi:hypothetical protein
VTPETLHDALSLGMALRYHWQQTRGETISDHEPFTVHFEGDRIVVRDRGDRTYLLTFRPFQRPGPGRVHRLLPVGDRQRPRGRRDPVWDRAACHHRPPGHLRKRLYVWTPVCAVLLSGPRLYRLAGCGHSWPAHAGDRAVTEVLCSILRQDLGVMGAPVVRPLLCQGPPGAGGDLRRVGECAR